MKDLGVTTAPGATDVDKVKRVETKKNKQEVLDRYMNFFKTKRRQLELIFKMQNIDYDQQHIFCQYDEVINCIAHTKTYEDEKALHWAVNFDGVVNLVNLCNDRGVKLIQISTDYYTFSKAFMR